MTPSLLRKDDYIKTVFDILPLALFVVDHDFNIFDLNPAASKLFGVGSDVSLRQVCGQILHCLHAIESEQGCGTTTFCPDCVIRNSVESACAGNAVQRTKHLLKIQKGQDILDVHMLVTASPFEYEGNKYGLLAIEDITELNQLRRLIPICSSCKKIRNGEDYWELVTDYLNKHEGLEFTHSLCPDCAKKLYSDLGI